MVSTEDFNDDRNIVTSMTSPEHTSFRVVHVTVCPSTNAMAREAAREGEAAGVVFVADAQTAGRGRHGRSWISTAGQNLLFSVLLRPSEPVSEWGKYSMVAGLAVTDALTEAHAGLKWPNDIVVDGRKCGGILMERVGPAPGSGAAPPESALVVGVGLNVNQTDFPGDYAVEPVSVALCLGRPVAREALLHDILRGMSRWQTADADAIRAAYRERLVHLGASVSVRPMDGAPSVTGRAMDVATDGALVVEVAGERRVFHAGDVTLRPA